MGLVRTCFMSTLNADGDKKNVWNGEEDVEYQVSTDRSDSYEHEIRLKG